MKNENEIVIGENRFFIIRKIVEKVSE